MAGLQFLQQGDAITRAVALLLLCMSVASWVVIVWKAWLLRRAAGDVARSTAAFWQAASVADAEQACHQLALRWNCAAHARDGQVMLWIWERDCDGVEAARTLRLPANPAAVEERIAQLYEDAEGPVSWRWVPPTEWTQAQEAARHVWRDTFAEAAGY